MILSRFRRRRRTYRRASIYSRRRNPGLAGGQVFCVLAGILCVGAIVFASAAGAMPVKAKPLPRLQASIFIKPAVVHARGVVTIHLKMKNTGGTNIRYLAAEAQQALDNYSWSEHGDTYVVSAKGTPIGDTVPVVLGDLTSGARDNVTITVRVQTDNESHGYTCFRLGIFQFRPGVPNYDYKAPVRYTNAACATFLAEKK